MKYSDIGLSTVGYTIMQSLMVTILQKVYKNYDTLILERSKRLDQLKKTELVIRKQDQVLSQFRKRKMNILYTMKKVSQGIQVDHLQQLLGSKELRLHVMQLLTSPQD